MAKDPRFNFYPDNWSGGTKRMSFEQKGAYMELLLLNFYCFSDGLPGFTEDEALKVLGNAAACAELWTFLMPKFNRDGIYYYSERMSKEFKKAKKHSEEQSKRANKRWQDAAAYACNGIGIGNGFEDGTKEGVQGKPLTELETANVLLEQSLDEGYLDQEQMKWPHLDFPFELETFRNKVRGSPGDYGTRDVGGIRLAFQYQLRNSKGKIKNGTTKDKSTEHLSGLMEGFKRRNGGTAPGG